jgi:hypothetical protein
VSQSVAPGFAPQDIAGFSSAEASACITMVNKKKQEANNGVKLEEDA